LQQAVSERGFSVVHVGNDTEISDMVGHKRTKYTRFGSALLVRGSLKK
jgi:hypothetical protein